MSNGRVLSLVSQGVMVDNVIHNEPFYVINQEIVDPSNLNAFGLTRRSVTVPHF